MADLERGRKGWQQRCRMFLIDAHIFVLGQPTKPVRKPNVSKEKRQVKNVSLNVAGYDENRLQRPALVPCKN